MTVKLPWEPGFVPPALDDGLLGVVNKTITTAENDVSQAVGAVNQATRIGSEVAGEAATTATIAVAEAATAAAGAVKAAGEVVGAVVPPLAPSSSAVSTALPGPIQSPIPVGGALLQDLESVALNAAKQTAGSLLPGIEAAVTKRVAGAVQVELSGLLSKIEGGTTPDVPDLADFTKADARSRAIRTLLIGLALSALWGLVNVLGNVATVDWTNRDALPQVLSIAVTSVVGSVVAYVGRVLKEPAHVANATIIPGTGSTS